MVKLYLYIGTKYLNIFISFQHAFKAIIYLYLHGNIQLKRFLPPFPRPFPEVKCGDPASPGTRHQFAHAQKFTISTARSMSETDREMCESS